VTGVERVRAQEVLRLERVPVQPDPLQEYTAIGVRSFGRGLFHYDPVAGDKLGSLRFFELRPDRLVISNIKGWEGAVALSSAEDGGCLASNRFLVYDAVDQRVDLNWARWFFLSEPGNELLQRASPGSADRNRTLAVKRFEDLVIPLPDIDMQLEQAAYLDHISQQARETSAALAVHDSDAVITALPPLVDELVGRVASERAPIGGLVDLVSDTVHPGDPVGDADSFVGLQHIERHTGHRTGADTLDSVKGRKFRFRPGDVVYGYLRPYLNKVWAADRHGLCSVDQYVLRPRPGTDPRVLAHILRGQAFLSRAIELTHSLQLPRLRSALLTSLDVPVVAEVDAPKIAERLDAVRDRMMAIAARRDRQAQTADALTPAALNHVFGSR
jgi:type I restriction enzyme, S subunit